MENKQKEILPSTPSQSFMKGPSYVIPTTSEESSLRPQHEPYILDLRPFVETPKVDFGMVLIGTTASIDVWIRNSYDSPVQVMLDKVPAKSNFEAKPLSMCLDGDEMKRMVVNWSPSGEGSTRGMIRLVVNEAFRVQFVVLGCAIGSAKARKSKHPGSRRHIHVEGLCQTSKSCHVLSDVENVLVPLQDDDNDYGEGDPLGPYTNKYLAQTSDLMFQYPSKSCTFLRDDDDAYVGNVAKIPLQMINNRVEMFADEDECRARRGTYLKRDLHSKTIDFDVHHYPFNANSSNNEGQRHFQSAVTRCLFPVNDQSASRTPLEHRSDGSPMKCSRQSKQPLSIAMLPKYHFKLRPKQDPRKPAEMSGLHSCRQEILNHSFQAQTERHSESTKKATLLQSRSSSKPSESRPKNSSPVHLGSTFMVAPNKRAANSLQNLDQLGVSLQRDSANLARYGTYTKLNEELTNNDNEVFDDSIEQIDHEHIRDLRPVWISEMENAFSGALDAGKKKQDVNLTTFNDQDIHKSPVQMRAKNDEKENLREFLTIGSLKSIENVKTFITYSKIRPSVRAQQINEWLLQSLTPKAYHSSRPRDEVIHQCKGNNKVTEANLPDICQISFKNFPDGNVKMWQQNVGVCEAILQSNNDERAMFCFEGNATSTPKSKGDMIGAFALSPIRDLRDSFANEISLMTPEKTSMKIYRKAANNTPSRDMSKTPLEKKRIFETFVVGQRTPPRNLQRVSKVNPQLLASPPRQKKTLPNPSNKGNTTVRDPMKSKSQMNRMGATKEPSSVSCKRTPDVSRSSTNAVRKVPKARLKLVKPPQDFQASVTLKNLMPFASKNIYYDERWMDKQERGFTKWINYALAPSEFDDEARDTTALKLDSDTGGLSEGDDRSDATVVTSKDWLLLKAYSTNRRLNQLRRAACRVYQSPAVARVIDRVEREVDSGRLAVRTDRIILNDYGLRTIVKNMIFSYNLLWLRLGLETVYGEVIPLDTFSFKSIEKFLDMRFFSSPDISTAYAHPTINHIYNQGFQTAVTKFTLKKFLLLVYFLDVAKSQKLIRYDPCLFAKAAPFKTSKDILLAFSRECLRGEGDITRHLSYMGYIVICEQTIMDEFDYTVTNLSQDLRDGIRLAHLVEVLTNDWSLSKRLLPPPMNKTKKIHNVDVVLEALKMRRVSLALESNEEITAKDIVGGHRQRTLQLLWRIIFSFQVTLLLDEKLLEDELNILLKELPCDLRDRVNNTGTNILGSVRNTRDSLEPDLYNDDPLLSLLLKWCRVVCINYGMKVENFTVSFSDGRAFGYLMHHYHPRLLTLSQIKSETTLTCQRNGTRRRMCNDDDDDDDDDLSFVDREKMEQLIKNEKENFQLLKAKMYELGGMPIMIKTEDMLNTMPDEKLIITCVSFLCSRLLELRREIRAAQVIQRFWRYNIYRKKIHWMSEKDKLLEKERMEQKEMLEKKEQTKIEEDMKRKGGVKKKKKIGVSSKGLKKSSFKNGKSAVLPIKLMPCSLLSGLPAFQSASTIVKSTLTDSTNGSKVCSELPQKCSPAKHESCGSPVLLINLMRKSSLGCKRREEPKDGAGREARSPVPGALIKEKENRNVKSPSNSETVEIYAKKSNVQKKSPDFYFSVKNENAGKVIKSEPKTPSRASPQLDAKTWDVSGSENLAVDNFSDETVLRSITLDYDDEVMESLGLNMVDKTGTIYHTPRKSTPLKRNVGQTSNTYNTSAALDKPSKTIAIVPKKDGNKNVFVDDHVREVSSQSEIRLKIEKNNDNLDQEIFLHSIASPIIFRKKPTMPDKTRLKNNFFIETCKDSEDEDDSPAVESEFGNSRFPSSPEISSVKENCNSTTTGNKRNTVEMSSGDFEPVDPKSEPANSCNELAGLPVIEKIESDIDFINLFKNLKEEELSLLEDQNCLQEKIEVEGEHRSEFGRKSETEAATGQTLQEFKSSSELNNYNDLEILKNFDSIEGDLSTLVVPNETVEPSAVDPVDECCVGIRNLSIDSSHCLSKDRMTKKRPTAEEKRVKIFVSLLRQLWIKYLLMKCNQNPKLNRCLKIKQLLARKHFLQSLERDKDSSHFKIQSHDAIVFDTLKQEFANNLFKMIPSKKSVMLAPENHFGPKVEPAEKLLGNCESSFIDRHWYNMRSKLICIQKTLKKHQTPKDKSKIHSFSQEEMSKENNLKDLELNQDKDHLKKVVLIQSVMRSYLAKVKYQREVTSVIRAQAHLRSFVIRRRVKTQRDRIILLQSIARTYLVRKRYLEVIGCTEECSYLERIKLLKTPSIVMPTQWSDALNMRLRIESACKIQTAWRRFSIRCNYERTRMRMVNLQAVIRGHLARKRYQGTFECIRAVQILGRAFIERQKHMEKLKKIIFIQAYFRMVIKRREFLKIKNQIIFIQSLVRRKLCVVNFERQRNRIVMIQSVVRTFLERKAGFQEKLRKVIKVQSHVRKYLARKTYLETLEKIRKCQAIAKGWMVRKKTKDLKEKVVVIQSFMRMTFERKSHLIIMERIGLLQRHCWGFLYSNRHRINMEKIVKAQAIIRGFICRKRYAKHLRSTLLIQKLARGFQARMKLHLQTQLAACLIHDVENLAAWNFVNVFNAFVLHQLRMTYCAIKIQSTWRSYSRRKSFLCIKQGFIRFQAVIRGQLVRRQAFERLKSILVIQVWWRRRMMRKKMIILIQLEIENFNINKIEKERVCAKLMRSIMAAKIQNSFRKYQRKKLENAAASKIQSFWRGRRARLDNPQLQVVRDRLFKATKNAMKTKILYNRTQVALENLFKYKHLSCILEALMNLEVVTSLSPVCCEKMAEGNAITSIVQLIQSCNRSVPHLELLKYAVSVLLNLTKCDKTVNAVFYTDEMIGTVLGVMGVFKEKEEIFINSCTLLSIFASDKERKMVILHTDKVIDKIRSIHDILSRKVELEKKHKMKQVEGATNSTATTSTYFSRHANEMPHEASDKVKSKGGQTFAKSFQAIRSLMKSLSISLR